MQLLANEEVIVSSNQERIVLTNQRIHQADKEWGRSYLITVFLEDISSIEMLYKSNPVFLVLAAVSFAFGVLVTPPSDRGEATYRFGGVMVAIVFLILWLYSKRQVVMIASNGGSRVNFRVDAMKKLEVEWFINKVISAKSERANCLMTPNQN